MDDREETPKQSVRTCSRCGAALTDNRHAGLCPRCTLRTALIDEHAPIGQLHFAGYDLLEKIGEGGMGVVYKARPEGARERIVALKRIRDGEFAEPSILRRFLDEIKVIAALRHPHIVPILEIGEYEHEPYYTMEYFPGGNLAQHTNRYADPKLAARLIAKVARAVHAGHEKRILHRDVKPANVLFDEKAEPYLADFGLAKQLDNTSGKTTTGVVLGTAYYMPPERATDTADRDTVAADIWSLGVILYELLAGRRPFFGRSPFEVLRRVVDAEPEPLDRLRPGLDHELVEICRRCLDKAPGRRYAMAKTLAEQLEQYALEDC